MKAAGIIAEYNPFHKGHQYHIEETRKETGADYIIVCMSGDFVQRGGPAMLDSFSRAKMALSCGADLVIAMPVTGSLSAAGDYAASGANLLAGLGVVTHLSFGCEARQKDEQELLFAAARILADPPAAFHSCLSSGMQEGLSYPAARQRALFACLGDSAKSLPHAKALLSAPNNILALEYLRVLAAGNSGIRPCMIPRQGMAYHDTGLTMSPRQIQAEKKSQGEGDLPAAGFASASALRRLLLSAPAQKTDPDLLRTYMPPAALDLLMDWQAGHRLLSEADFDSQLYYALRRHFLSGQRAGEKDTGSDACNPLLHTFQKQLEHYRDWQSFALACKGKNRTLTSVSRALAQLLLGISPDLMAASASLGHAPYARILGFKRDAAPLLLALSDRASIPVLTKLSRGRQSLSVQRQALLDLDLFAADLCARAAADSHAPAGSLLRRPLVYL